MLFRTLKIWRLIASNTEKSTGRRRSEYVANSSYWYQQDRTSCTRSRITHPDQDFLLSSTRGMRIYQMHKKSRLVTGIATKVCHVLWLLEILNHDLRSGYVCVPPQAQGTSSCVCYPSGQFWSTGVQLALLPSSVLPN